MGRLPGLGGQLEQSQQPSLTQAVEVKKPQPKLLSAPRGGSRSSLKPPPREEFSLTKTCI